MKSVCLLSGGKDSFLAAVIALDQGLEITYALTVIPEDDSMMFHVPNIGFAEMVASILDLKTIHVRESEFQAAIEEIAREGNECIISGAIASEYQKTRIERLCTENDLISYTPLWRKDQERILKEVTGSDIGAIIVSVSAEGLGEEFLGKVIDDELINALKNVSKRIEINLAGEGGEYETFVVSYNGRKKIEVREKEVLWKGASGFLIIKNAILKS